MPDTDKASPRPWTAAGTGVYGADGYLLADFAPPPIRKGHTGDAGHWATTPNASRDRSEEEEDGNVALTLRAVNAHAALVAAVKKLIDRGCAPEYPPAQQASWDLAVVEAEAALKLAE